MGNNHSGTTFKPRKNVHWKTAEPPLPPRKPEIIPITNGEEPNAVTLRWSAAAHDGGAPLKGFQVECNRIGSSAWIQTSPPVVTKPELILTGLEPGYKYQFRVCALNAVGLSACSELSDILTISMDSSPVTVPKFTTKLHDVTCLENDKTEFRVSFEGTPIPTVAWFKDGFEIFSSRRTGIVTDGNSSVLVFHQALLSDEGEIKCTATNRAGHVVTKARFALEAAPKLRYPRQYEDGLLYEINETIYLKTSVVGQPLPSVEWRHDGRSLVKDERIDISNTDKFSVLRIHNAQRNDRGEYQIFAKNAVGEDTASFLVTITAPPNPPRGVVVSRQIDKSVTLTWSPPLDDGGCKIGNYVVEYYRTGWNVWLKAATSRKLSTTLFDLIEGSEYRFRVKAESPYGMSEPSEESAAVRIPGESVDMDFLAVESRIINDALVREDGEDVAPLVSPRRKRIISSKKEDSAESIPKKTVKKTYEEDSTLILRRRSVGDPSRHSTRSPTGSTEFMLILYPENNKSNSEKRKSYQLEFEDSLSPPPLSLSAPDLGSTFVPFRPIRNSVSSSELLNERAMDRFYRAVAMKEALKVKHNATSNQKTIKPEITVDMYKDEPDQTTQTYEQINTNEYDISEEYDYEKEDICLEDNEKLSSTSNNKWIDRSFEDDYTASTVSSDSEQSDASFEAERSQIGHYSDDEVYHPKDMIPATSKREQSAAEVFSKPAPLPNPNFIPKPILKRRDSDIPIVEKKLEPEMPKKPEKMTMFKKFTKMPIQKSFPFPKIKSKKQSIDDKDSSIEEENILLGAQSNKGSLDDANDTTYENLDEGSIAIEYYGNIVKEFGRSKRPSTPQYLNTEQLKQAAEIQVVDSSESSAKAQSKITKKTGTKIDKKSNIDSTKLIKKTNPSSNGNKVVKYTATYKVEEPSHTKRNTNKYPSNTRRASRASIVIPIDYDELEMQAKINVRSAIDYTVDVGLLMLACWLYIFKDERLAIPVLVLIIYRQLHEAISLKIPLWLKGRKVKEG